MSGETDGIVVRRSDRGWQVGSEQTADLTSAMVLADLLAADLGAAAVPSAGPPRPAAAGEEDEAARLAVTVAQLEHALAARVRVEQAIGVLAERHRLRPRGAFDLLRSVARASGERVIDVAENVVGSASNPLLPLPAELAPRGSGGKGFPPGAGGSGGSSPGTKLTGAGARVLPDGPRGSPSSNLRHVGHVP